MAELEDVQKRLGSKDVEMEPADLGVIWVSNAEIRGFWRFRFCEEDELRFWCAEVLASGYPARQVLKAAERGLQSWEGNEMETYGLPDCAAASQVCCALKLYLGLCSASAPY